MLVDSHCHLDFPELNAGLDDVLVRARANGVATFLTIGTRLDQFEQVRSIAEQKDDVWCSVGIHPHEAAAEPIDEPAALIDRAVHPRVVGIGEAGLDFYYEHSPRSDQIRNFRAHICAARETGLPLIIHERDASAEMCQILDEEFSRGSFRGLIHCFTSSSELAKTALSLGLSISISGIITFKKTERLRAIVAEVPLDRLLVETDSPYLAPVPMRGKTNEPAYVRHVAECVANIKQIEFSQLAEATTNNFFSLFDKARRPA